MADAPARKGQKPIWYVVGCIGLAILCIPCVGVLAAIAIPAFVNYTRRAKTAEAHANVAMIARGVEAYCAEGHDGLLPPAAGPTLSQPTSNRQTPTIGAEWASIGFAPAEPTYYAYSMLRTDTATLHVLAEGDLDGDGTRSRFETTCTAAGASCACGEVIVTNELE